MMRRMWIPVVGSPEDRPEVEGMTVEAE